MIYLDLWTYDEIDSIAYQWSYWGNHVCLDMDKPTDAYFPSRLHFRQLLLLLPIYKTGYNFTPLVLRATVEVILHTFGVFKSGFLKGAN